MQSNHSKRILIVEDAEDIQFLLTQLLEAEGYQVDYVANGQEAIEFLTSSEHLPGLILLDLMMPVMNGYQFREVQEKHAQIASIPVLLMTAGGDIQSKSIKAGAKGFLKKPFVDIPTILETVGRFFPS